MTTDNILTWYMFALVFGFVYYFLGRTILRPFRSKKMKELANEFGLNFSERENLSLKNKLFSYTKRKNILEGEFHG